MDVDHCLRLLQSASSDNDKMAALMLVYKPGACTKIHIRLLYSAQVARLVKSDEIGPEGRKRVFNAVGFSFINRLFATSDFCCILLIVSITSRLFVMQMKPLTIVWKILITRLL